MKTLQRLGVRSTDPAGDSGSWALDGCEVEVDPGPESTRGPSRDTLTYAPAGDYDDVDPGRVVAEWCTTDVFLVYHRDIPGIHAEGPTRCEAAANLARNLAREIDCVVEYYREALFGQIFADIRAFSERSP